MTQGLAILLEDDPVTAEVMASHLLQLGYSVRAFASLASLHAALPECLPARVALIDLHLPDGHGTAALPWLRTQCDLLIASSADWTPTSIKTMQAAGFAHCLSKPCDRDALQRLLDIDHSEPSAALDAEDTHPALAPLSLPLLDDAAALRALGSPAAVAAMRALFRDELKLARTRLQAAFGNTEQVALRAELHRLLASTGFVGAVALNEAVASMQILMTDTAFLRLDQAIKATLEAISASIPSA